MLTVGALAQSNVPPSYGHDFVTVGAAGNRAANDSERNPSTLLFSNLLFPTLGAVNYSYRITKNEVTAGQWFEFVKAYSRFADQDGVSRGILSGRWGIGYSSLNPAIAPNWTLDPNAANLGQNILVNFAPIYCNWLHNGRPTGEAVTRAAFETGAYEVRNSGQGQSAWARLAGARYWMPSIDEWVKAAYYDPNRYGEGQGGYWSYSGRSAIPLIGGPPGVGQTSAGWNPPSGQYPPNVGAYPGTVSPWGLLDTSGGNTEFTDTIRFPGNIPTWMGIGAEAGSFFPDADYLGYYTYARGYGGFRVASLVPSPGVSVALFAAGFAAMARRRRMT